MCGTAAAASSVFTVMRTSSEPARASAVTCCDGALDVGGVGVGHRLHDDGRAAADDHGADADGNAAGEVEEELTLPATSAPIQA